MRRPLSITFSVADQNFQQTKSVGILNLSVQLPPFLAQRPEIGHLVVLSNSSLEDRLTVPSTVAVHRHDLALRGKLGRIWWDQWRVYSVARRLGNEWLYLPKGFASFCRRCPMKLVTCVADANHDYYVEHYPGVVPALEMWYFQRSVRATISQSSLIFTISEFTASEVARLADKYRLKPPPIRSIGIGFERIPVSNVQKQARLIVFAGRWPHKRTDLALEYLERWQNQTRFTGTVEWVGRLPEGRTLPGLPNWQLMPRLPEDEFRRRIAEAQATVYFSDYEGFGMPPVEAIIAGTEAVYSDLPVTREVMAGAGRAFSNSSFESFANALNAALSTSPEQLRAWGDALLARHNWETVADRVIAGLLAVQEKPQSLS
jgi:glycosyltransferase involved in cell wall biosynthesis